MTLKERFQVGGAAASVAVAISVIYIVGSTVILLRMNNQQCVPEMGLWKFYEMNRQLSRIVIFFAVGFFTTFIDDLLGGINIKTWNSPMWLKNVLKFIGICFFSSITLVAIIAIVYHLFIKSPC